jgi:hypothetical protein
MKSLASLLVVALFIQSTLLPYAAFGAEVTFNSTQSALQGQVPVHKIGALLLSEGLALLNGDEIKVEAKDSSGHAAPVLQGNVFNITSTEAGSKTALHGYAFFRTGTLLSKVETACSDESVDLKDGSHVAGPISDVTHDMLTVGARQVATSAIATVHSPRVYQFKMNLTGKNEQPLTGPVTNMDFSPTCLVAHAEPHYSSTDKKRAILVALVVAGLATGIACGVAIPLGVHHHHHNTFTFPTNTTPPVTVATVTALPVTPPPKLVFVPSRIIVPPRITIPVTKPRGIITTNVNSTPPAGGRVVNPNGTVTGTVVLAQGQGSSVTNGTAVGTLPFNQRVFVLNPNLIFFTQPPTAPPIQ